MITILWFPCSNNVDGRTFSPFPLHFLLQDHTKPKIQNSNMNIVLRTRRKWEKKRKWKESGWKMGRQFYCEQNFFSCFLFPVSPSDPNSLKKKKFLVFFVFFLQVSNKPEAIRRGYTELNPHRDCPQNRITPSGKWHCNCFPFFFLHDYYDNLISNSLFGLKETMRKGLRFLTRNKLTLYGLSPCIYKPFWSFLTYMWDLFFFLLFSHQTPQSKWPNCSFKKNAKKSRNTTI